MKDHLKQLDIERPHGHRVLEYHVDRQDVSAGLCDIQEWRKRIQSLGFLPDDFVPGSGENAPIEHWTHRWPDDGDISESAFEEMAQKLRQLIGQPGLWRGYCEGEHNTLARIIPSQVKFDPSVSIPFTVEKEPLPPGHFRESEIHVTYQMGLPTQRGSITDERLFAQFEEMGFYPVEWESADGVRERIYTLQAASRYHLRPLLRPLFDFMRRAGGTTGPITVEREDPMDYFMVDESKGLVAGVGMPPPSEIISVKTPPVIKMVKMRA